MKHLLSALKIILVFALLCGLLIVLACCGEDKGTTVADEIETGNAGDAQQEETPAPTPAPEIETEPPTEKPKPEYDEVLKWTFSEADTVFKTGNQMENFRVEGNILKLTSVGGDPFMHTASTDLGINAADVDIIRFKIINMSDGYSTQLFFITNDDTGWDEPKSLKSEYWYSEGEAWEELEFDTSDSDLWEGTIKQIRFDPLTNEGDVEIEYVQFLKLKK